MKKSQECANLHTTKTPSFINRNSISINKKNLFKKRVVEKEEPYNLVETILSNMDNLYKMMGKNSNTVLKKPGYQNYVEVE